MRPLLTRMSKQGGSGFILQNDGCTSELRVAKNVERAVG